MTTEAEERLGEQFRACLEDPDFVYAYTHPTGEQAEAAREMFKRAYDQPKRQGRWARFRKLWPF